MNEEEQAKTIFPLPLWIVLLIVAFCWPSIVFSQQAKTYTNGEGDSVILYEAPCTTTAGFFEDMPDNLRPQFKAAFVRWNGTEYQACWVLSHEKHFIVDETGDRGFIEDGPFSPRPKDAKEL